MIVHDTTVGLEPTRRDRSLHLDKLEARFGHSDRRTDVDTGRDLFTELVRDQMPPWIERDDGVGIGPLRKRPDGVRRIGIGQIGPANGSSAPDDTASAR